MAIFSKNRLEILSLLFAHGDEEYHLHEIGRILGKRPGVFQRAINSLEKDGVVRSRRKRNQRLFSINRDYILFEEVRSIINKTCGVEGLLRDFVESYMKIKIAVIFGSYAKDRMSVSSDIDLLLVATTARIEDDMIEKLATVEQRLQREVNYKIYLQKEFRRKIARKDPFLEEVLSDQYILLKGKI